MNQEKLLILSFIFMIVAFVFVYVVSSPIVAFVFVSSMFLSYVTGRNW